MKHRLFVAANLPPEIKNRLLYTKDNNLELPAKWTKKENLHITLVFLGDVADEDLLDVFKKVSKVVESNKSFSIKLNRILYGPTNKLPPRMVWVEGEKSNELGKIQKELEESLSGLYQKQENRGFTPHITLARIKTWEWKQINPEERPNIEEELNLDFEVNSIEVMESYLKRGGSQYEILESYQLKEI